MLSKEASMAIMVSDAKKSAAWYKDKLGFETSTDEGHWVTAWPKGANWRLHLCEGDLEPGNTGVSLYTGDIKKVVADLKKKGVKFARDYTKTKWGENAMVEDPDGNVIWINAGEP